MVEPIDGEYSLETLLAAEGEGPATQLDHAASQRIVDQVIAQATAQPALEGVTARPAARPRRAAWLLLAALVLTGSAAAMYRAQRAREEQHAPAAVGGSAPALRAAAPPVTSASATAAPAPIEDSSPKPSVAAAAVDGVVPVLRGGATDGVAPALRGGATDGVAPALRGGATSFEPRSAQDLLERANRLRGAGKYRAAERMYLRAAAQSSSGPVAYTARVAAAALRIEQLGEAQGALRLFQEAERVNSAGALAPEIHEGMAQAYRKLGRAREERAALSALLADRASGPAAERARQRLQVLDAAQ